MRVPPLNPDDHIAVVWSLPGWRGPFRQFHSGRPGSLIRHYNRLHRLPPWLSCHTSFIGNISSVVRVFRSLANRERHGLLMLAILGVSRGSEAVETIARSLYFSLARNVVLDRMPIECFPGLQNSLVKNFLRGAPSRSCLRCIGAPPEGHTGEG